MAIFEPMESTGESRKYNVKSPVTMESIGEFTAGTDEEVHEAVARARAAQPAWAALSFDQRAEFLWKLVDVTVRRMDELIDIVIQETGKTRNEAVMMEAFAACMQISHYAKRAGKYLRTAERRASGLQRFSKKITLVYQPLGVVGLITPWNGPVALTANPFAQAVMAGNTVVHKPSEVTPFSAKLFEEFTREAGFPEGVYQVVQGDGATGAALLDAGLDKVSFTGSVATGRKVGETCGRNLIPCTLELGGKDAMIVCRDADLDRAADGALRGSFFNTGHYCCGTERVYVPEAIYDDFVAKVVDQASKLKQSATEEGDVGAVFWDRQMDIIEAHMRDARAKGAKVLLGGDRRDDLPGYFFPPTVVTEVENSMDLMTKETFGPIIAIQKVADEEEAIEKANDSDYGLSGTVWTTDLAKGLAMGKRILTGSVIVNDISVTYGIPEAPFGGLKSSGVGQVNGETGIRGYCHPHPIIVDKAKKSQGGYPYTAESAAQMEKFAKFLYGNRFLRRLMS
ncbi:MAG: aldehyde dehydrogenase family protein [Candidatus Binatia bacterium]|jgi:succinate-semialdehyde dehydrogenase/glutarate-semialdehyde dehydrogenase|nr:aldehyde dehydrogenase family protein [Candidatus Binatia bacterium]MDG2011412.1 aldehyde dehydrogenase family protein [Candidatus Binatia bacterium]HAC81029.1 aldehyde dehydrogenase [Deltaproteobacteria bacterium]